MKRLVVFFLALIPVASTALANSSFCLLDPSKDTLYRACREFKGDDDSVAFVECRETDRRRELMVRGKSDWIRYEEGTGPCWRTLPPHRIGKITFDQGILRLAHSDSKESYSGRAARVLATTLRDRSMRQLRLDVRDSFGSEEEVLQAAANGDVELAFVPVTALQSIADHFEVFDLLFLFNGGFPAVDQFTNGLPYIHGATSFPRPNPRANDDNLENGEKLLKLLDRRNLLGLGYLHDGMRHFLSSRPILRPRDLANLKVGTSSSFLAEQFGQLADSAVPVNSAEVEDALSASTIDVAEITLSELQEFRAGQQGLVLTLTGHSYAGFVLVVNLDFFRALSDDAQTGLKSTVLAALRAMNKERLILEEELQNELESKGLTIRYPEDVFGWMEVAKPFWDRFKTEHETGPEILEAVQEANSDFASAHYTGPPVPFAHWPQTFKLERRTQGSGPKSLARLPYWNAWFQRGNNVVPHDRLVQNKRYTFVLDLAPYHFSAINKKSVASTSAHPSIAKAISGVTDPVMITLRPFLTGPIYSTQPLKETVVIVDPKRFSEATDEDNKNYQKFRSNQLSLPEFAKNVRAAWIKTGVSAATQQRNPVMLELKTRGINGCGVIGFSIWDEDGTRPLDHLVFRVPIGGVSAANQDCLVDDGVASFESGFNSLLATAAGRQHVGEQHITGGLHVFEVNVEFGETLSIAVLADGRDKNFTKVYSWKLDVPLSKFFHEDMPHLLKEAQTTAITTNQTDDIKKSAYGKLSEQLYKRIFAPYKTKERHKAQSAWGVLQKLAEKKSLVVTRLVDRNGYTLYAPLSLLHAGGDKRALKGDLTIVQALPRERYISRDRCVKEWTYLLPQKLEEYQEEILEKVNREKPASGWLRNIFGFVNEDLFRYLQPVEPDPAEHMPSTHRPPRSDTPIVSLKSSAKAEGLLTVAHQSHGAFWFDKRAKLFRSGDIQRPYPPGSVAVLATCEAAGIDNENRTALTQFNARGVDLIIAAPFQVRVSYGARLAVKLDKLLRKTNADGDPKRDRRLVSLFKEAANQVAADDTRRAFGDMRYEFLVLGDHELRLCPPEAGENR